MTGDCRWCSAYWCWTNFYWWRNHDRSLSDSRRNEDVSRFKVICAKLRYYNVVMSICVVIGNEWNVLMAAYGKVKCDLTADTGAPSRTVVWTLLIMIWHVTGYQNCNSVRCYVVTAMCQCTASIILLPYFRTVLIIVASQGCLPCKLALADSLSADTNWAESN